MGATLVSLLVLAVLVSGSQFTIASTSRDNDIRIPGSGNYNEDFTTITYLDGGATTADGWGTGTLTSARDYAVSYLGFFSTPDPVTTVDVQGRKAYIGLYDPSSVVETVRILNISDPTDIQQLGFRSDLWSIQSVKADGDILYTGRAHIGTYSRLFVYNVSNPTSIPPNIDLVNGLDGDIVDLEVQGHFLYMACANVSGSFRIFDVEDPSNVEEIYNQGWINLRDIEVEGQLAYMAHSTYGMKILNVSNPYVFSLVGQVNTPDNATGILVDGHLAYVADGASGVQILDVSDPASPAIIGSYDTPGHAESLALQGATLYVADGTGGLQIVDVSNPTDPLNVTAVTTLPYTYDVDLYGGDVVVAAANGVHTFRIGDPTLYWFGSYTGHQAWDVVVQGDIAYIAGGSDGLITVNVSDTANPVFLDSNSHNVNVNYVSVDIQGPHVYVTCVGSSAPGLIIYDVSDPANIALINYYAYFSQAYDVFVEGDVAYIADGTAGLYLENVSDPFTWQAPIDSVSDGNNYTSVWVQGPTIYTTCADPSIGPNRGLYIYDATDLSNLNLIGRYILTYLEDIAVDGDFCALADSQAGMYFMNVTDPFNIQAFTVYDPGSNLNHGVRFFGPYVVAAFQEGGVYVLNTTNPRAILNLDHYAPANIAARRLSLHGDFVYVANTTSLEILRLFRSAGATYNVGNSIAQSTEVDTTTYIIENATLTVTNRTIAGTSITWQLSADGGSHWESVIPGVQHTFTYPGSDLRWRATLSTSRDDHSARLYSVAITYEYNNPPSQPTLTDPGTTDTDGIFQVSWTVSTDPSGYVVNYELQMSDSNAFTILLDSWTPTATTQVVGLSNGTYYFRVRAIDDDSATSDWSNIEDIEVAIPPTTTTPTTTPTTTSPPPIPGFPGAALLIGLIAALGLSVVARRRKR
jgi:hypothetical protein